MRKSFKKIIQYLLNPGYVLGIGVFFENTLSKRKHRQLIQQSHPNIPRWQAMLFYIFCFASWYLVIFWCHLVIFSLKKHPLINKPSTTNTLETIRGILYCGLWIGVSPLNFYVFKLANTPKDKWWNHIFIEESLTWHNQLNRNQSNDETFQKDKKALNNKNIFAERLTKKNIPCVQTLFHLPKGSQIKNSLFSEFHQFHKNIFIKPIDKNAMRGCFKLRHDSEQESITFAGNTLLGKFVETNDEQEMIAIIQKMNNETDLLIQPLLLNSKELTQHFDNKNIEHLITLRLVSIYNPKNQNVRLIYACLELPKESHRGIQWEIKPINIETGAINTIENCHIPDWQKLKSSIQSAHQEFVSIKTIAWDVCLSSEGIKIIEGNFGWNIIEQQNIHSNQALDFI